MKKVFFSFLALLLLVVSCSEDDNNEGSTRAVTQEVSFGMSQSEKLSKSDVSLVPAKVILTVKDVIADTLVYDHQALDLYNFSGEYLTQNTTLYVGQYSVEEYHVADKDNVIIYSTPKQDSELADYVSNPLPLSFTVAVDETAQVLPEVIAVDDEHKSEDFGYPSFGFDVIDVTKEQFGIVAFDQSNQITDFNLVIKSEGEEIFNEDLEAQTNYITISPKYDNFELVVSKDTFDDQTFNYTRDELNSLIGENNIKIHFGGDSIDEKIYEGDVELYTIEEYNEFVAGQYTKVTGTLSIGGFQYNSGDYITTGISELTDLKGLETLRTIGHLFIGYNENLTSLNGLQNLKELNSLSIKGDYLSDWADGAKPYYNKISDLSILKNIKGLVYLSINLNSGLKNLKGLENVTNLAYLEIGRMQTEYDDSDPEMAFGNPNLINLEGLSNLKTVNGNLTICGNENLTSLNSLNNLESVNEFYIGENNFDNLHGLENLKRINEFYIGHSGHDKLYFNSNLKSFEGLSNLEAINGLYLVDSHVKNFNGIGKKINNFTLVILQYDELESFEGLENVTTLEELTIGQDSGDLVNETHSRGGIQTVQMKSFKGLESLTRVNKDFLLSLSGYYELDYNISNQDALKNIQYIGGNLEIGAVPNMYNEFRGHNINLTNFENLKTINGNLTIDIGYDYNYNSSMFLNLDNVNGEFIWINEHLENNTTSFEFTDEYTKSRLCFAKRISEFNSNIGLYFYSSFDYIDDLLKSYTAEEILNTDCD